jgi:hypothetical protein
MDCKNWDTVLTLACLHDWQDFWAGILAFAAGLMGFAAAIYAVIKTLGSEQRKAANELSALKKALGAELRHFARGAYDGAVQLKSKLESSQSILIRDAENATQFPSPVVYQGNSSSLGFLGERTPEIVLFYNRIEIVERAARRLSQDINKLLSQGITNYSISKDQLSQIIEPLIEACETAVTVLPSLKTSTSLDANDSIFPSKVTALREEWRKISS